MCRIEFDINTWITKSTPGPLVVWHDCPTSVLVNLLLAIKHNDIDVWGEWRAPSGSPLTPRYWQGEIEIMGKVINVDAYGGSAWHINATMYIDGNEIILAGYGDYGAPSILIDLLHDILLLALGGDPCRFTREYRYFDANIRRCPANSTADP